MATAAIIEAPRIRAQPGPQEMFLACRSDIAFMGGSVFGGKTWALCAQPLLHVQVPGFSCVTFRRTSPDIRNPGSLWEQSMSMYPYVGATPREHVLEWDFESGALVKFDGLPYDTDVLSWKSAQIALVQFDQAEEFTEYQFWYMQSRNRSMCGITPYTRASCNAMADTWVADFIQWWWDPESGYAIKARSGMARWFLRVRDQIEWATILCPCDADEVTFEACAMAARREMEARYPGLGRFALSFAFIRAGMDDNKIGVAIDPQYEARVRALPLVEQERLLGGNWKIRAAAGLVFNRGWFGSVPVRPTTVKRRVRYWDKAGTAGGGDWTAGVRESEDMNGVFYIEDVIRGQWGAGEREGVITQAARDDPPGTIVVVEQEPGSGGKDSAEDTVRRLSFVRAEKDRPTGQLVERAGPLAAQAQVSNVKVVQGAWVEAFLRELHAYPTKGVPDDQVAAASGAHKILTGFVAPVRRRMDSRSYFTPR